MEQQTNLDLDDGEIRHVERNEGYIYGEGAANLLRKIKKALLDLNEPAYSENPELCAKTIHGVLREASAATGQNPDIETYYRVTGEEGKRTYYVSWESGPDDWAINGSMVVMNAIGRLCEPYYGFDLQLYDVE